jgi:DNA topoisomerase-1
VYTSKSKNAQEAHEAIRPVTPYRTPKQVEGEMNSQELALYRLIWQRTLASQMADATGVTVSVRLGAISEHERTDCEFAASGTTITFPGYRAVYVAADDEGDGTKEALLPPLAQGEIIPVESLTPNGHTTSPPARYTEASLVKRLEELEIGRPSTWASIIQTIQDRGYVWKKGQALVPTWTAFAVVGLLEQHFTDLVDYELTAKMDDDLDALANGQMQKDDWLKRFYFGDDETLPGLKRIVEENLDKIDAAAINTFPLGHDENGELIVAKPGKYGPYVKRGDDTASVPDDLAPDELDVPKALELLALPKSDEPIGEMDGYPVYAKNGRFGPYVQWGAPDDLPPGLEKPRMSSLFSTMSLDRITIEEAAKLLQLPRSLGQDPADGKEIVANNGRYGPYVVKDKDFRSIDSEAQLLTITIEEASKIFALPKVFKRGGRNMAAAGPLREFGTDPVSERPVVAKDGRFGVYVTDGETNASIGKGDRIEEISPERAFELLAIRRDVVAAKGGTTKKKAATRKKPASKKAAAKRSVAKKSAVAAVDDSPT